MSLDKIHLSYDTSILFTPALMNIGIKIKSSILALRNILLKRPNISDSSINDYWSENNIPNYKIGEYYKQNFNISHSSISQY